MGNCLNRNHDDILIIDQELKLYINLTKNCFCCGTVNFLFKKGVLLEQTTITFTSETMMISITSLLEKN